MKNLDNYEYLLFDLDNTLLDFNKASSLAFKALMKALEIDNFEAYYEIYYPINAKYWHYYEKQKISADEVKYGRFEAFIQEAKLDIDPVSMANSYLDELVTYSFWINGAQEFLDQVKESHKLAIISNGLSSAQHRRLEKHGMKNYFEHIFISEELGVSKPHKAFFDKVHQSILVGDKSKVLVIGDNPKSDIKGARNFGYHSCWYNYKRDKKARVKSNYSIDNWEVFLK
ncbi:MAG: noncanonical pyrimidine nucleotidase, YjjG family [Chitinophagales bacterium]|nr:noncanonical pyrimidine nucleotidase, YjjG family [Chitinophagales bacterium]